MSTKLPIFVEILMFKNNESKYSEYVDQTNANERIINSNLYDEIEKRNGETELFVSLLNNEVIPKIQHRELDDHEKNLLYDIVRFLK